MIKNLKIKKTNVDNLINENYEDTILNNSPKLPTILEKIKITNNTIRLHDFGDLHGLKKRKPTQTHEWHNSVYSYNTNYNKLLPIADSSLIKLVKKYFTAGLTRVMKKKKIIRLIQSSKKGNENKRRINKFRVRILNVKRLKKRLSWIDRILLAKGSIKHTSNSALISLFVFNKERSKLIKRNLKIMKRLFLRHSIYSNGRLTLKYWKRKKHRKFYYKRLPQITLLSRLREKNVLNLSEIKMIIMRKFRRVQSKLGYVSQNFNSSNFGHNSYNPMNINKDKGTDIPLVLYNTRFYRRRLLKYNRFFLFFLLNKKKFEKKYLENLRKLASKIYNKNVIFNFVTLKKYYLNSSIYTQILAIKLKNRKMNLSTLLGKSLNNIKVPTEAKMRVEIVKSTLRINKINHNIIFDLLTKKIGEGYWFEFILSKYHNAIANPVSWFGNTIKVNPYQLINKNVRVEKSNEDLWMDIQSKCMEHLRKFKNMIYKSVNDKKLGGLRIQAKGRLTKRFKASRSVYKLKWIGGLRNIHSSYKGLSTGISRGHALANVEYTTTISKRKIGAYGVKGWVSSLQ